MGATMRRLFAAVLAATLAVCAAQAQVAPAPAAPPFSPNIVISPARANGLYAVGERVSWTVRQPLGMPGANYTYEVRENNFTVLQSGALDLSSGAAVVEGSLSRPGMISLVLRPIPPASGPAPNV